MGKMELRQYQREALNGLVKAWQGGMHSPMVVAPTGAGKALMIATFIRETLEQWPDTRIVMLVHTRELVSQNFKTLLRDWPQAPVTVYSAGLKSKDLSGQIVFASIQSIFRKAYDLQKVDLVVIDEAHLIPPSGDGMYRKFMSDLAVINGGPVPMAGFTATPYRMASGSLVEGEGRVFDGIAHEIGILELIDGGYLVPPMTKQGKAQIDIKGVKVRGGEFVAGDMQRAADKEHLVRAAVEEIVAWGKDRRSWLVFSSGVDHAFHIRDEIRRHGITCETVTGETTLGERDAIVQAHKDGRIKCLTNDSVLTTGYDNPGIDLLAVMRATLSPGLWVQMLGRGLRIFPGKSDCIILDYGNNTFTHGPLDQIKGKVKGAGGGPAPMKECPDCQSIIFAGCNNCPDCGHEFEIQRERKMHGAVSNGAPLLSSQVSDWLPVNRIDYKKHGKPGKPATLRVDYWCGFVRYSEWQCFDHPPGSFPRRKAEEWWKRRCQGMYDPPATVDEALDAASFLDGPSDIRVRPDGDYYRIVQVRFGES